MTCSEFERMLNHCAYLTKFWLFLRVGEFCLFLFYLPYQNSRKLEEYICYFNNERVSLTLKGMSPVQYRTHSMQFKPSKFLGSHHICYEEAFYIVCIFYYAMMVNLLLRSVSI